MTVQAVNAKSSASQASGDQAPVQQPVSFDQLMKSLVASFLAVEMNYQLLNQTNANDMENQGTISNAATDLCNAQSATYISDLKKQEEKQAHASFWTKVARDIGYVVAGLSILGSGGLGAALVMGLVMYLTMSGTVNTDNLTGWIPTKWIHSAAGREVFNTVMKLVVVAAVTVAAGGVAYGVDAVASKVGTETAEEAAAALAGKVASQGLAKSTTAVQTLMVANPSKDAMLSLAKAVDPHGNENSLELGANIASMGVNLIGSGIAMHVCMPSEAAAAAGLKDTVKSAIWLQRGTSAMSVMQGGTSVAAGEFTREMGEAIKAQAEPLRQMTLCQGVQNSMQGMQQNSQQKAKTLNNEYSNAVLAAMHFADESAALAQAMA
jgi:hypothetical protein